MHIANWYTIPDFTSYEININDKRIRSLKHYRKDCFHIMKVNERDGTVRIVDDTGKLIRVTPEALYELTFNSGKKLMPREDNAVYKSGMVKGMRKMKSNIDVLNGIVEHLPSEPEEFYIYDFYKNCIIEDNDKSTKDVVPDYMKIFEQPKIKPFIINPKI